VKSFLAVLNPTLLRVKEFFTRKMGMLSMALGEAMSL
jgi:hypothetical protein